MLLQSRSYKYLENVRISVFLCIYNVEYEYLEVSWRVGHYVMLMSEYYIFLTLPTGGIPYQVKVCA